MKHPYQWFFFLCTAMLTTAALASGRGRHKKLYVVPKPGAVTVDGDLKDWDLSGQIHTYVIPETAEMQSSRLAMMYDKDALYISGVVKDTSPMMNRHDPKVDPKRAWDADVCQVFMSLDPRLEYPVEGSSFAKDPMAPVGTMYLWYFTDRKEPCLAMYRGMRFNKPLRPDLSKNGVIPKDKFDAAYKKGKDGNSYTFEYRIPFDTIGLKAKPKANDILAAVTCTFWSRPDGLKTAGGAAWAYDVMAGPGFPWQSTLCYGKLIFSAKGNIPRELVEEGLPPEKPLPLKFAYNVPEDSQVTVQLYDEDNTVVRLLVAQGDRRAGKNVELWDGLDSKGAPLPPGKYTWKGIYHAPIKQKALFSPHNSGKPTWPTDNNRGGWGGDHGAPTTVSAIKNGMILAWSSCEYGWGIIKVDLKGNKKWGSKHAATYMANDGKRLFAAGGHGFHRGPGVKVFDLRDCRPIKFGTVAEILPEGGDDKSNYVTGLAYGAGRIYVAYAKRNLIGIYDAGSGAAVTTVDVPDPHRLAVAPDKSLVAISAGTIVRVKDGNVTTLAKDHLDQPTGVAVAKDGTIYVTNQGELQSISVFDASGKYLRSLGKKGGRPAIGKYDPAGMYQAGGVAVDDDGRIWVAETTDGPKRISVWDAQSGKNLKEYFGACSYFGYGYIDPAKPNEMYAHHVLWEIDWKKNTTTPKTTVWRKTEPNMIGAPNPAGYGGTVHIITAKNGTQYMWGGARHKSILLRRDGDIFKPFLATMHIGYGWSLYRKQGLPLMDDKEKYGNGQYLWQDANDDQIVQPEEVAKLKKGRIRLGIRWCDKDLTIYTGSHVLRPQKWNGKQPIYDLDKLADDNIKGGGYLWRDDQGNSFTLSHGKQGLTKWAPTGEKLWNYPNLIRWRDALNLPIVKAGRLWGMTGPLGVAGDFSGNMTYFGVCHVYRRDGVYVAALNRDGRTGGAGPDVGQPEGQAGQLVKLKIAGKDRYFLIAGGQDARVIEVFGLDTVKDLPGGTYEHTEANAKLAKQKLEEYKTLIAKSQRLTITRGRKGLDIAPPVRKITDTKRSFEVRAAYDENNLYLRYDVTTKFELANSISEPQLIFKGGNCLDIQMTTQPPVKVQGKKGKRELLPGDVRILITRQAKKPFVMVYKPRLEGFAGEPVVFKSPTGQESFDLVEQTNQVKLDYKWRKTKDGFRAYVTIPHAVTGWTPKPGTTIQMDVGYIYGNKQGSKAALRAYWMNNGFSGSVLDDIPNESRLEPHQWGKAQVE